jgi:hypothetical protein
MAKMLAAAHGRNQAERPSCCKADDRFRSPRARRTRARIQRHREKRQWKREARALAP